jgi:DNA-binding HxlR family transcriptional regulator
MLTQTLRGLERDGLVSRSVTPSVPLRFDDELTALGRDLEPLMSAIRGWAENHLDDVLAARSRHDTHR